MADVPTNMTGRILKMAQIKNEGMGEAKRDSVMSGKPMGPAPMRRGIGFNRKMDGKGSEYRPGIEVPAIEESLMKDDNLG